MGLVNDGTAIGSGLATAVNRLKEIKEGSKVVILLTDGKMCIRDRLYKACRLIGISMGDHVIFTDNGYYSYLDNGRLGVGL